MRKIYHMFCNKPMDEMETQISLQSKSYAQFFTMAILTIWVLYDLIRSAMSYDYKGSLLPCFIILGSYGIEGISKHFLTKQVTSDDEEYVREQKAKQPEQLTIGIAGLVLTIIVAVTIAALLRYIFFLTGVLK